MIYPPTHTDLFGRIQKNEPTLDTHNVAWVDEDENDDDEEENENGQRFNVREVSFAGPAATSTGD